MLSIRLRFALALWIIALVLASNKVHGQTGSSSSRRSHPATQAKPALDKGVLADNLYRNRFIGFSYKVPFGWVDRTDQLRDSSCTGENLPRASGDDAHTSGDCSKSLVLLSVYERPPEATADTVNSSVLIAAESVSTYPGLKDASQYFGPLTEVTTSKGFKVVNEPYDVVIGTRRMVRGDYSKELGKLTMHQSTLAIIDKGYVVSFTFIGGSEDEVEELIGELSFTGTVR